MLRRRNKTWAGLWAIAGAETTLVAVVVPGVSGQASGSSAAGSASAPVQELHGPPASIDGYTATDTVRSPDMRVGTMYQFKKAGEPQFFVFIFAYDAPALIRTRADAETDATQVAEAFVQSGLPWLLQQRQVDNYRVAFVDPDSVQIGDMWLHGTRRDILHRRNFSSSIRDRTHASQRSLGMRSCSFAGSNGHQ